MYLKITVVVIETMKCQALYRQMSDSVGSCHTIRRPQQLDNEQWLQRPQLQHHDGHIVCEQQAVRHRHTKLHQLCVRLASLGQDSDSVEQPECHRQDEDEKHDEGAENGNARQSGPWSVEEHCPGGSKQDNLLECKPDQHCLTVRATVGSTYK